ncbi:MAG: NAD(P)/FAD-dependent oxidoreductase [Candidatus Eremiobacteraeota bacterium]|nr:NAD(P)/FAD-dependent oxidoreductase [Candidatus Eremiobacteraeota bacterium]
MDYQAPRSAWLDNAFTAAALAIPLWAILELVVAPAVRDSAPAWTAAGLRAAFPALILWVLLGLTLGASANTVRRIAARLRPVRPAAPERDRKRVLILGGGFAGMTTAAKLEELLAADRTVEITLVSDSNALLFTPMLAEVAGSSIEPTHISSPLRSSLRRTRVVRGRVCEVDLESRRVAFQPGVPAEGPSYLEYDELILALGGVSNFFGQENIKRVALDFKSLPDAIRIRNHVIALFERAEGEPDPDVRRRLLTFVVAGGGFAGIELAGALNDFARGILDEYPHLAAEELRVVVVHARERILPELSESLAAYALERMSERGVQFKLNRQVANATADTVLLHPSEEIEANTLVWTAGTAPNPLIASLDVARDKRGAVIVNACMSVPGHTGLWALGDCAAIPNLAEGGTYPPTAQHALREAATLAFNIRAVLRNEMPRDFRFEARGSLCVIGHQAACAEVRAPLTRRKLRFSGLLAWLMWRAVYLSKLPGFERKVRVLVDWVAELYFPRDTVQTIELI